MVERGGWSYQRAVFVGLASFAPSSWASGASYSRGTAWQDKGTSSSFVAPGLSRGACLTFVAARSLACLALSRRCRGFLGYEGKRGRPRATVTDKNGVSIPARQAQNPGARVLTRTENRCFNPC